MPKQRAAPASKPTPLGPRLRLKLEGLMKLLWAASGSKGRPTLVCGSAGCGKTLLAMEFLVRGARQFDEAGV